MQPLWKAVWSFLKKLKGELPFDSVIPLLGVYPRDPKTLIQKNKSTPMFTVVLFTIIEIRKQPKCPSVDEWIKQLWNIYTVEYYLAINIWMDLENIMLSEISHSEKDKCRMISLICGI